MAKALDNNPGTLYSSASGASTMKVAASGAGGKLSKLTIKARNDGGDASQAPYRLVLTGSNDDISYTAMPSPPDLSPNTWTAGQIRDIVLTPDAVNWKYIKVAMTSISGAIAFEEIDIFNGAGVQIAG